MLAGLGWRGRSPTLFFGWGEPPIPAVRPQLPPHSVDGPSGAIDAKWLPLGTVFAIKLARERMALPQGTPKSCSLSSSASGRSHPIRKVAAIRHVGLAAERSIDTLNERGMVERWQGSCNWTV